MKRSIQIILIVLVSAVTLTGFHFFVADAVDLSSDVIGSRTRVSDVEKNVPTGSISGPNPGLIRPNNLPAANEGHVSILLETGSFILLGCGLVALAGWGRRMFRK